jgi:hypothetical protein
VNIGYLCFENEKLFGFCDLIIVFCKGYGFLRAENRHRSRDGEYAGVRSGEGRGHQ